MPVRADTAEKEINFAVGTDKFFVVFAFFGVVAGHAVEKVGVLRLDIDVFEKVFFHKIVVALRMSRRQADVFVHIKSDNIAERNFARLMLANKFPVSSERG